VSNCEQVYSVSITPLASKGGFYLPEQLLREGYTTGSCAAAAAKAAVLAAHGEIITITEIFSPQGQSIIVPIYSAEATLDGGSACVIKDGGDDPDITHGTKISVTVKITSDRDVILQAGEGVGVVTKPGLSVAVGQPAINPGPRLMIEQALAAVLPVGQGAIVTITVPDGVRLAKKTLNPILGIEGGISIIGTTGIVKPMSEEAFKNSLTPQISVVRALGYQDIVFVPGRIGQNVASERLKLNPEIIVQTSNFIGHMLENALDKGIKRVLIIGHLGKIVKVAAGIFHTHNRVADARLETLAAYAATCGASQAAVEQILACTTTEAAMTVITAYDLQRVYLVLARRASLRAERYVFGEMTVGTVIATLKGEILAADEAARAIGGALEWNIKSLL
jgi:cobalt-precorrin-5B (C1)-methyltransferase